MNPTLINRLMDVVETTPIENRGDARGPFPSNRTRVPASLVT
jgi:hypothetical protein